MRRFGVPGFLLVSLLGLIAPLPARADNVSDAAAAVQQAQDRIEYLQEQVAKLEEDQRDAEANLEQAEVDVADAEARIATLETKLSALRSDLGALALDIFIKGDEAGGGSLLTGAATVTEAVEREQYARVAMSAGQSSTDQLDSVLSDLEAARQDLQAKQKYAEQTVAYVAQKQKERDAAEVAAADALAQAQTRYGNALQEEAARRQAELIAKQQAEREAAARRIANASNNNGGGSSSNSGAGGSSNSGNTSSGNNSNANADAGTGSSNNSNSGSTSSGNSGAGRNVPAPSPGAGGAVAAAKSQVGVGYSYATASPGVSFDCSGLTYWAWAQAGVILPRNSRAQYAAISHVSPSDVQPGDLIFFYSPISHVGLYIGGGMMVDAANKTVGVRQTAVNWGKVTGVGRPG
ncbi:MAG: NlpC/P60 family protein [Ilumatobacteraceae bacterium]